MARISLNARRDSEGCLEVTRLLPVVETKELRYQRTREVIYLCMLPLDHQKRLVVLKRHPNQKLPLNGKYTQKC